MAQRLIDTYRPDDPVEILFRDEEGDEWRAGRVVALQPPGVWVLTEDRRLWFVTNGKHIRPKIPSPPPCEKTGADQDEG